MVSQITMVRFVVPIKPIIFIAAAVILVTLCRSPKSPPPDFPMAAVGANNDRTELVVQKTEEVVLLNCAGDVPGVNLRYDPPDPTFYDDPTLSYTIDSPVTNWDEKRVEWLKHHPSFVGGVSDRVLVLSGSQQWPCKSPTGDHLLLRLFKNKVDYCRIHGYDIFYNNALLHPKMPTYWAKLPVVRAAMLAHPETEWIFWVDSDAVFTDMEFTPPLERYKDHNLVVDGWPNLIYEKKSWIAVNAGVFLIRNCQWSLDFMDVWGNMAPKSPEYEKWGQIMTSTFTDKMYPTSDDQSALIYLLLKEKETWGNKIYIENKYTLSGYWAGVVDTLDKIVDSYAKSGREDKELRRRHAEKVTEYYGALRESRLKEGENAIRRPFITHFTGCQPCSGEHPGYSDEDCWNGMERTLNFADNQVLRNYGFVRPRLENTSMLVSSS